MIDNYNNIQLAPLLICDQIDNLIFNQISIPIATIIIIDNEINYNDNIPITKLV